MPSLTIRVVNAKLVQKNLQDLHAEIPRISQDHITKAADRIVKQMRRYPPARPGSKYIRTYRLRDSWKVVKSSKGATIKGDPINRGTHYGTFVVGDAEGEGQAWMHVGTWLLFRDVADYEMTRLPDAVERSIRFYAQSKGLTR